MKKTQPQPPAVSLTSYRLIRLLLEAPASSAGTREKGDGQVVLECGAGESPAQPDLWVLRLRIFADPPPLQIAAQVPRTEAEIEGHFRVHASGSHEEQEKVVRLYGGALLYALLRGMLSAPASLFSSTLPVLPTVNMSSVMAEPQTKKPKQAASKARPMAAEKKRSGKRKEGG